jgi:hypothetical protein
VAVAVVLVELMDNLNFLFVLDIAAAMAVLMVGVLVVRVLLALAALAQSVLSIPAQHAHSHLLVQETCK